MINTLTLGEVTIQGRRYLAILHHQNVDGSPLEITQQMKDATAIYQKAIQQICDQVQTKNQLSLLTRISDDGFEMEDETVSHQMFKTEKLWFKFCQLLTHPQSDSKIELIDLPDWSKDEIKAMVNNIHEKCENDRLSELTKDEKRLLDHFKFNNLSSGKQDWGEMATLISLPVLD